MRMMHPAMVSVVRTIMLPSTIMVPTLLNLLLPFPNPIMMMPMMLMMVPVSPRPMTMMVLLPRCSVMVVMMAMAFSLMIPLLLPMFLLLFRNKRLARFVIIYVPLVVLFPLLAVLSGRFHVLRRDFTGVGFFIGVL